MQSIMRFHLFRGKSIDDSDYTREYGYKYIRYKHYFNLPNSSAQAKGEFIKHLKEYKAKPETEVISSFFKLVQEYADIAKYSKSEQALVSRFRDDYKILLDKATGGAYTLEYFEKNRWNKNALTYRQQKKWDYHKEYWEALERPADLGGYYHSPGRFHICAPVGKWLIALISNEIFVDFLAKHLTYLTTEYRRLDYPTAKQIWEAFTKECDILYAYYGPRDTQENLLVATRMELEAEISEFEEKVRKSEQLYQIAFEKEQQRLNLEKETQKARHDRFVTALDAVLAVFLTDEGKIKTYSTEWMDSPVSQQTFSDKKLEIANNLTQLEPRQAMVKTQHGEWLIETPSVDGRKEGLAKKRQKALESTRDTYHFPTREEVEAEIAARIATQPTQRKHTLT